MHNRTRTHTDTHAYIYKQKIVFFILHYMIFIFSRQVYVFVVFSARSKHQGRASFIDNSTAVVKQQK